MIQSFSDYKEYLRQDAIANIKREKCSWWITSDALISHQIYISC